MQRVTENQALSAFLRRFNDRLTTLASEGLRQNLPRLYRPAAKIVGYYASGQWRPNTDRLHHGFKVNTAKRSIEINRSEFGALCEYICNFIVELDDIEIINIRKLLGSRGAQVQAIMSGFFHYFFSHELLHIEQGLGSDQYIDSDFYLSAVMEADYEADICGLVIAAHAPIPEFDALDLRSRTLFLVAIHIASMHGFSRSAALGELSAEQFARLALWYLHYARFAKSPSRPRFSDPSHYRSWIVLFPRLIAPTETKVTFAQLEERHENPYPTTADIVVAHHGANGLYRIHRAAMTDPERTLRLCEAIIRESFDDVREEFEELLILNPTLSSTQINPLQERIERQIILAVTILEELAPALASHRDINQVEIMVDKVDEILISIRVAAEGDAEITELCAVGARLCRDLRFDAASQASASQATTSGAITKLLSVFAQLLDLSESPAGFEARRGPVHLAPTS